MNSKIKREIKDLERQKKRALQHENFTEAAKFCNLIGETLSSNEFFEEAIVAHTEEINFSSDADDVIGIAVGNRKVGECLCGLKRFDEALVHQKQHLRLAKSVENLLEQQRALATLGRTYFMQSDCFTDDEANFNKCLVQSQKCYLKSLEICNRLNNQNISDKELLEMKARLYLNLGLTYEYKQDIRDALKFVNKALIISREQKLKDDIYRCHYTLSGLHLYDKNYQKALQSARSALTIAKDGNQKQKEMDALFQMGMVLLRLGEFESSLHALKKVYKSATKANTAAEEIPVRNLKLAMQGIRLHREYNSCEDKKELLNLCEKLGDFYHEIKVPEKALEYYLQQRAHANSLGISGKSLATIYISIAVTYGECKQQKEALKFYQKELGLRQGELKENSSTYCAMAKCMEDLGAPFDEIKTTYMKALECAQGSGNKKAELAVLCDFSETLKAVGQTEELQNVCGKMKQLESEISESAELGESEVESEPDPTINDGGIDSSQFNSQELQMLESDSENENDEEEVHLGETTSRAKARQTRKKVNKKNERGETPLHLAAISGDAQRTNELLRQGADVKARDYCGWQPLHEACNHGAVDVVKLLLEHGANVNDPGGAHCGGVTPLHDASQNGHLDVVKILVSWKANVHAKTKEGFTPIELVQKAIEADNEEFSGSYAEDNALLTSRKEVEKFLSKFVPSNKRQQANNVRNMELDEDIDNVSSDDQRFESNPALRSTRRAKGVFVDAGNNNQLGEHDIRNSTIHCDDRDTDVWRRRSSNSNLRQRKLRNTIEQNRNKAIFDDPSSDDDESARDNDDDDDGYLSNRLPFKRQRVDDFPFERAGNELTPEGSGNEVQDSLDDQICIQPSLVENNVAANDDDHQDDDERIHSDLDLDANVNDEDYLPLSPGICTRSENSNDSCTFVGNLNNNCSRNNTPSKNVNSRLDLQVHNGRAFDASRRSAIYRPELQSHGNNRTSGNDRLSPKKKHFTRVIQSKIGFTRSPSPSMLDENDSRLQNCIVNDIPVAKSKNKNKNGRSSLGSAPKKQQSRIDFSKASTVASRRNTINSSNNRKSPRKNQTKRKFQQQSIGPYTQFCIQIDSDNDNSYVENGENMFYTGRNQSRRSIDTQMTRTGGVSGARGNEIASGPLFRIKVRIAEQCYLIPCQQANAVTIGWLTEQAVSRYHAASNVSAKLALKTKDGALLNADDVVSEVVMNNEELVAEILGFQFPSLLERYTKQCTLCDTEPLSEMLEQFSLEDDLHTLRMEDLFLHRKEFQAVFSSILCTASITCINLSGIFIGDSNFTYIVPTLHSLPNIYTLNLTTTGITTKSLSAISNVVSSQPKQEYKLIMKESPLSMLRSLHLGYNDFSNEEGFSAAMKTILKRCKHLEELNIPRCQLTTRCFQHRHTKDAIKGSNLKSLNLSYNSLGNWQSTLDVVSLFNTSSLECLDVSSTTSSQSHEKICLKSFVSSFQSNLLQELHMDSLPAISNTGDPDWFDPCGGNIRKLSLRHQACSIDTFHSFIRHASQLKHLQTLDCSFSKTFNEEHFDGLLNDLRTHGSPLEVLNLSSCNICSRLPERIYKTFYLFRTSSSMRLRLLDLSFNELSMDDQNKLKTCWEALHRTVVHCDLKSPFFCLRCS